MADTMNLRDFHRARGAYLARYTNDEMLFFPCKCCLFISFINS